MKHTSVVIIFALIVSCGYLFAQEEPMKSAPPRPQWNLMKQLNLTPEQKSQLEKIKYDTDKKAIDLRSAQASALLELRHLLMADAMDQAAIEKKINELADAQSAIKVNELKGWFAANKLLNAEQQKIWKTMLLQIVHEKMNAAREMRMNHRHGVPPPPVER